MMQFDDIYRADEEIKFKSVNVMNYVKINDAPHKYPDNISISNTPDHYHPDMMKDIYYQLLDDGKIEDFNDIISNFNTVGGFSFNDHRMGVRFSWTTDIVIGDNSIEIDYKIAKGHQPDENINSFIYKATGVCPIDINGMIVDRIVDEDMEITNFITEKPDTIVITRMKHLQSTMNETDVYAVYESHDMNSDKIIVQYKYMKQYITMAELETLKAMETVVHKFE